MDLYQKVADRAENKLSLSSLYLSLRYRIKKNVTLFASYDNRRNVIYYETYKDIVEKLLESETRQGLRFRITYRPVKYMTVGMTSGYRFQKSESKETKNINVYVTYSRVPWLKASATISGTLLQSSYLEGKVGDVRITRDIISGKLYGGINYRWVDYRFSQSGSTLNQHLAGLNMTWRIMKKLSLSLYYEGVFEKTRKYNRIHLNLVQRF